MPDYRIRINVDPSNAQSGTQKVNDSLKDVATTADRVRGLIEKAFAFTGIGLGLREIVEMADAYNEVSGQIRTFVSNTATANAVMDKLVDIADATETSFSAVAEAYRRVALATSQMGLSQRQMLEFTESLENAAKLSGASADQAASAVGQLSRGLVSGRLEAAQFRSIFADLPVVADTLAKSLGISTSQLYKFLNEGRVTSAQFVKAFIDAQDELAARAAKTGTTISESFTVLKNELTRYIGDFDRSSGATGLVSTAVLSLARNLDLVARVATAAAIAIGTKFAIEGVEKAIEALESLNKAILANPFGSMAKLALAAASILISFSDEITVSSDSIATLQDIGVAAFSEIGRVLRTVVQYIGIAVDYVVSFFTGLSDTSSMTFKQMLTTSARFLDTLVSGFYGTFFAIEKGFAALPESIINLSLKPLATAMQQAMEDAGKVGNHYFEQATNRVFDEAEKRAAARQKQIKDLGDLDKTGKNTLIPTPRQLTAYEQFIRDMQQQIAVLQLSNRERAVQENLFKAENALNEPLTAGQRERITNLTKELQLLQDKDAINDRLTALDDEISLLGMSSRARERESEIVQMEEQLHRKLTASEREEYEVRLKRIQALQDENDLYDEIRGPFDDYANKSAALTRLLDDGRVSLDEYNKKLRSLQESILDLNNDAGSGYTRGILKVQDSMDDLASTAENVVVDAFGKAEDAIVSFVRTGQLSLDDLVNSVLDGLTKIAVQEAIMKPLADAIGLGAGASANAAATGSGGGGSGLFDKLLSFLPGFATGGSFDVGGSGGTDSQLVAFRASPDETVTVSKGGDTSNNNVFNFNITTPDVNSFKRSQGQLYADAALSIGRAQRRNS